MTSKEIMMPELASRLIDNTLLAPTATAADFEAICSESRKYNFKMVAINSARVALCREFLCGSEVSVGAAISFPLGQCLLEAKLHETFDSLEAGAQEIDYVINIGRLKDGDNAYIEREMKGILDLCRDGGAICKVIFENCYLTQEEKETMCRIAASVGPDFVKTSTGFGTGGATVEDVALMKRLVGPNIKVKAAGGIRNLDTFLAMVDAGAERIGTSSGAKIIDEMKARLA